MHPLFQKKQYINVILHIFHFKYIRFFYIKNLFDAPITLQPAIHECNPGYVSVPPMIWIQNQLVGAYEGQQMTLECHSEAYPKSINYWTREDRGDIIAQGTCSVHGAKNQSACNDFIRFGWPGCVCDLLNGRAAIYFIND